MSCSKQVRSRRWEPCPTGQTGRVRQVRTRTKWKYKSSGAPAWTTYGTWSAWVDEDTSQCRVVVASDDSGNGPSGDPGDGGGPAGTTSGGGVTGDDTGVSSTDGTGSNQGLGDPGTHEESPPNDPGEGEGGGSGGGPGSGSDGGSGGENGGAW